MMKRALAAAVAALALSALPAFAQVSPAGQYPIVKDKITLKVFTITNGEDLNANLQTQWLEKKTGIHIEWVTSGQNEAKDKLAIMLASGSDLPDIIMPTNTAPIISDDQIANYGEQGIFIPLDSLIEKYGVNAKKGFKDFPGSKGQVTSPDGHIYALPTLADVYHTTLPQKFWINKVWLDKLGLKMPETPDELLKVLVAFRDRDPNGNGKKDEIPLTGRVNMYSSLDNYLMNAFQYSPGINGDDFSWLYLENGKVTFAPTQAGWREGLRYFKRLNDAGVLDKEIFINQKAQLLALTGDPNGNRVGCFMNLHIGGGVDLSSPRAQEYVALPPLKGPAGRVSADHPIKYYPRFLITKNCKYPEIAFRLGDAIMTNPLSDPSLEWITAVFGPEGQGWTRAKQGQVGLDGQPALFRDLVSDVPNQNISWGQRGPCVYPDALRNRQVADPTKWTNEKSLYDSTKNVYEKYRVSKTIPYMIYKSEDAEQLAEIRVNVQNYVNDSIAKFTLGALDIDKDWAKYLKTLDDMGVKTLVALTQKTYDRYNK